MGAVLMTHNPLFSCWRIEHTPCPTPLSLCIDYASSMSSAAAGGANRPAAAATEDEEQGKQEEQEEQEKQDSNSEEQGAGQGRQMPDAFEAHDLGNCRRFDGAKIGNFDCQQPPTVPTQR